MVIQNASDGGLIDAPYGVHAIRVEKIGDASLTYYDFKLVNGGDVIDIDPDLFTDQSTCLLITIYLQGFFFLPLLY